MPQRPSILSRTAPIRGAGSGVPPGASNELDLIWGIVTVAPEHEASNMYVSLTRLNAASIYEIPVGQWMPRGEMLPEVGNRVLVCFDNSGNAWVPVWNPF